MQINMWRIYLVDEGVSNIITDYSDGPIMPELVSMPIISIYEFETPGQLIQFYHATMGYPCTSTWCKAIIAGYFKGCTGFTAARFRRFIKVVEETDMGHMDQQRKVTC